MLLEAQKEFDLDLSRSILIGDKNSDIEAGINAGVGMNYLVETGHEIKDNLYDVKILNYLYKIKEINEKIYKI